MGIVSRKGRCSLRCTVVRFLNDAQVIEQCSEIVVLLDRLPLKPVLAQKCQRPSRLALDVSQGGKGRVVLRGGMTVHAILSKSHVWIAVARLSRPIRLPILPAEPAPEPAIVGSFAVANHDSSAARRLQPAHIDAAAGRGRRRIHLLDHDGPIGDGSRACRGGLLIRRPVHLQPPIHFRRIPDDHGSMGPVVGSRPLAVFESSGKRSRIADGLVDRPS